MKWPWFQAPSTSKFVFFLMAVTTCVAFVIEIAQGKVTLESKDFMLLAVMAFSFYFAIKSPGGTDDTRPVSKVTQTTSVTTQGTADDTKNASAPLSGAATDQPTT